MARKKYDYDLVVLGSGGGGSVAAHIVAAAGNRVAIVEADELGGDCPTYGCVPTKALLHAAEIYNAARNGQQFGIRPAALSYNYPSVRAWKDMAVRRTGAHESAHVYESEGIKLLRGAAAFAGPHEVIVNRRHYSAEYFLIATGSHSFIPPIEGLDDAGYITHREAVDLNRPPKSLFVIGGGAVGCEFSELFSIFGSKVYVSEVASRLLMSEDQEIGELVRDVFETERGVEVLTNSKVMKVAKDGLTKRVYFQHGSDTSSVKVDEILIAAGRVANVDIGLENAGVTYTPRNIIVNEYMQTKAPHIYAAGDVVGPYPLMHMAAYQSRLAAHNILHKQKVAADYRAVPRCTFVSPEVASVGLTEDACLRRDLRIKKAVAPLTIIGRANVSNSERGFVKVITDREGKLLGATIACPRAGEMIHELTLAIQHGMSAADIANTIHAFPTWSEAVRIACNKVLKS